MTRVAFIADAHVANHKRWGGALAGGLNQRARDCVAVLQRSYKLAVRNSCEALFILGDLFHHTKPTPPLVRAVMDALRGPIPVWVILGNHDKQSEAVNDHAAASMLEQGIEIVDEPRTVYVGDVNVWAIPYSPGEAKDWLTSGMAKLGATVRAGARNVVMTHLGIFDEDTPSYMKTAHDAVSVSHVRWLCSEVHKVDSFFAGNWHDQRRWVTEGKPSVIIPGTVCPTSFSDPSALCGFLAFYDSENNGTGWERVSGPRFITIGLDEFANSPYRTQQPDPGMKFYYRVKVSRAELERAHQLAQGLPEGRVLHIELDGDGDKVSVREAARAANQAATGDAQLAAAELIEVQEPGTKDGVARRFEEYRKGSM